MTLTLYGGVRRTISRWHCGLLLLCLICGAEAALAGTNGVLEGIVKDKKTGEPLPGVTVVVQGLRTGSLTGRDGRFEIPNLRAGRYEVRISLVGYTPVVMRNIVINPDLRTRLSITLEPSDVVMGEITVVQEKPLIQKDVTGTTYVINEEDIRLMPLDNPVDVIRTKAGVTMEGNIRGGKSTEVQYLIDGLPVQDVMKGGLSTTLPHSSIVGLSVYTGGFEAEYGNALSGVVNMVTRTSTDAQHTFGRFASDYIFRGSQVSKTTEVEVSGSGPLYSSLSYIAAFNGNWTGTRWWQDFETFFTVPIEKTFSGFGKIDYAISSTMRLGVQFLGSWHDWRDYEFSWRYDLEGLPPERRNSSRVAAILSHTVTDRFAYTASVSRLDVRSQMGTGDPNAVASLRPYEYDFFLQYVIGGDRAWWARNTQTNYTAKFDGLWRVASSHMLKFGGEATFYNLKADVVKFEPRKTFFGKPLVDEPMLDFSTAYTYRPRTSAAYIHDKIDILDEGLLLNLGLRYERLDPRAQRPMITAIPRQDTAYGFAVNKMVSAAAKQQVSPRFGAALQVAENGYIFVNLGWYFQYPLFDYLYTGLDRVGLGRGVSALTGNPDLEPERSMMWELSLKYTLRHGMVASVAYFRKEATNLVDTKTFIPGDSKLAGDFGFAEYVNTPDANVSGVELVLSRERGEWVTGDLSYTYMVAEGSSGSPQDGFYVAQYGLPPGTRTFPLSWDQRHTVKANLTIQTPWDLGGSILAEWHSGRPYTRYLTSTGFEKIDGGRFNQNNDRMPSVTLVDAKIMHTFSISWWQAAKMKLYVDCRNVFNQKNVKWMDSNGRIGGELGDPSGYDIGRRTYVGIQADF